MISGFKTLGTIPSPLSIVSMWRWQEHGEDDTLYLSRARNPYRPVTISRSQSNPHSGKHVKKTNGNRSRSPGVGVPLLCSIVTAQAVDPRNHGALYTTRECQTIIDFPNGCLLLFSLCICTYNSYILPLPISCCKKITFNKRLPTLISKNLLLRFDFRSFSRNKIAEPFSDPDRKWWNRHGHVDILIEVLKHVRCICGQGVPTEKGKMSIQGFRRKENLGCVLIEQMLDWAVFEFIYWPITKTTQTVRHIIRILRHLPLFFFDLF